jgi:predicted acyltransferase
VIYGRNAIAVFVLSGVLARTLSLTSLETGTPATSTTLQSWLHGTLFRSWLPPHAASLGYALAWVLGWFVVLWLMYRRRWFLKV